MSYSVIVSFLLVNPCLSIHWLLIYWSPSETPSLFIEWKYCSDSTLMYIEMIGYLSVDRGDQIKRNILYLHPRGHGFIIFTLAIQGYLITSLSFFIFHEVVVLSANLIGSWVMPAFHRHQDCMSTQINCSFPLSYRSDKQCRNELHNG